MSDVDTLLETLRKQAIDRAAALDPDFKKKVEADQREIDEQQKRLDAQHAKKQEQAKTEWHDLWDKMK